MPLPLPRPPRILVALANVALVAGGSVLLIADSADCPDGYAAASFHASFHSTCPTDFAPIDGTLRIDIPGGDTIDEGALRRAFGVAGFHVDGASADHDGSSDTCRPVGVRFQKSTGDLQLYCPRVAFDREVQQITCTPTAAAAALSSIGPRATDASFESDAGDAGKGGDEGGTDAGGHDAGGTDAGKSEPGDGDSGALAPVQGPCTISFTKVP